MIRKLLLLLEGGVLLAAILVVFVAWQQHSALQQPLNLSEERLLEVPAGATPGGVLNRLQSEGVLRGAFCYANTGASTWPINRCTAASTA